MFWKKKQDKKQLNEKKTYPTRPISIHELRQAVQQYANTLQQGVPLSVIINDDLTIDYHLLAPYLKAIPEETYYMSKETYEIFEEKDKELAEHIDKIQRAVDQYKKQKGELPIIEGDPYKKVSYYKLESLNLISQRPDKTFYITKEEDLITYNQPTK
ncbi:putative transcriptional regulator [Salirhabdus euzebyi]|uniref:Putative transcriptional regulator n=1 Tax=Salirhabdus euzebyi TaxID=394506 RepID=A0A841Q8K1_9BACI|nr:DUF3939 domain-containing protein [Salirhabdus euzebyi]MBB6454726.1 putative transcriptional regulator [Salirhabdus euzebyi]